jgi:hypothetical protein
MVVIRGVARGLLDARTGSIKSSGMNSCVNVRLY